MENQKILGEVEEREVILEEAKEYLEVAKKELEEFKAKVKEYREKRLLDLHLSEISGDMPKIK